MKHPPEGRSPSAGPCEHRLEPVDVRGAAMLRHPESGVLFAVRIREFVAGPVYRYDERGRNVSVRYAMATSAVVSIYVVPFEPFRTAAAFHSAFEESVLDMLAGVSMQREVHERRIAFAHAAAGVVPGRRCEVIGPVLPLASQLDCSIVELFALGRWLLKIRASCRVAVQDRVEAFITAWLAASSRREG